jgi:hypothetical protein
MMPRTMRKMAHPEIPEWWLGVLLGIGVGEGDEEIVAFSGASVRASRWRIGYGLGGIVLNSIEAGEVPYRCVECRQGG